MFPRQTKRQKKHLHSLYGYQIDPCLINVRDCMGLKQKPSLHSSPLINKKLNNEKFTAILYKNSNLVPFKA